MFDVNARIFCHVQQSFTKAVFVIFHLARFESVGLAAGEKVYCGHSL